MLKIRPLYYVITIISFMVFVACSNLSTNNSASQPQASPSSTEVSTSSQTSGEKKFNVNTSLEPELDPISEKLKIDALYDKIKDQRPYKSTDELVSKKVLTQEQYNQVKSLLTLDYSLTGEAKDVDYLVKMGLMKGHLLVAKELLDLKRPAEALPHVGHPIEELYVTVAEQFPQRNVADFKSTLDEVKDFIKNKPQDPQVIPKFNAGMAAVDKAIAAIPETERKSPAFIAQVNNGLLDSASAEYGGAISGNKIEEIDYQDSRGFVTYAYMLSQNVAPQLQKDNAKIEEQLKTSFTDLRKVWPSPLPPAKPVATGDQVAAKVKKIEEITKPLVGNATTASIPASPTASGSDSIKPGLAKFKNVVTSTLEIAKKGNLAEAKKEWANASDTWGQVEDKIKAQSKDGYRSLEEKLSDVQTTLAIPPSPDKDKSIAALQSLNTAVDTYNNKLK